MGRRDNGFGLAEAVQLEDSEVILVLRPRTAAYLRRLITRDLTRQSAIRSANLRDDLGAAAMYLQHNLEEIRMARRTSAANVKRHRREGATA